MNGNFVTFSELYGRFIMRKWTEISLRLGNYRAFHYEKLNWNFVTFRKLGYFIFLRKPYEKPCYFLKCPVLFENSDVISRQNGSYFFYHHVCINWSENVSGPFHWFGVLLRRHFDSLSFLFSYQNPYFQRFFTSCFRRPFLEKKFDMK